jgi:hypothetical protein
MSVAVFSDRNYAIYALGNTISSLGTWAQRVGVGWLSWELSHSASWVGLVSLCQFLPVTLFAPLFGLARAGGGGSHCYCCKWSAV